MMAILWVCFECLFLVCLCAAILGEHPDIPLFAKCGVFVVVAEGCFVFVACEFPEFLSNLCAPRGLAKNKSDKGKR